MLDFAASAAPIVGAGQAPALATHSRSKGHGCRFCGGQKLHTMVDLGMSPLCENFLTAEQLNSMEPFYPLKALVCEDCFLIQVEEFVSGREIFCGEYAYFSSYSDTWLEHARNYAQMITRRLGLTSGSMVVELASNDGYLLKNFVEMGIPCLGIEPADNVATVARQKGVPTRVTYFTQAAAKQLVAEGVRPDLMAANNVLAHVPDLNDFVAGIKTLLGETGVLTVEFPHAVRMIEGNQFDTIYQEHYCYFSFSAVERVLAAHGLTIFDVEELPTHGGSLRIFARHTENADRPIESSVAAMRDRERSLGYDKLQVYLDFAERVAGTKRKLLEFLIQAKRAGKRVAAYGAPGKGNTLLNYCGIREDFLDYAVDRNPYKHFKYLPGTHIPVFPPEKILQTRPDYVLILPWNLKDEIMRQLAYVRSWGAQFVVPIPELTVS